MAQQPRIDMVSPSQGPIAGGTIATIIGANLTGATVKLDGAVVAPLSQTNAEVRLKMPPHDNGYALIQITIDKDSSAAEFLYVPPKLEDLPPGYITTVAGVGRYARFELPATQSMIRPSDLTVAANGDVYFMEVDRGLSRVDSQGTLHHVAGTLGPHDFEFVGDGGSALNAWFGFSRSVAIDAAGNAYITDDRGRIRKVDAVTGIVSTVAGIGQRGFSGDGGRATQAQIGQPTHIACAPDGTLYFLDSLPVGGGTPKNLRVRMVTPDGVITTIAGNGTIGDSGDGGPGIAASLNIGTDDGGDVALDRARNVFILEQDGQRIRRVDAQTGVITTFASLTFPAGDGSTAWHPAPWLVAPSAIAIDHSDNLYAASGPYMFKFDPAGRLIDQWGGDGGGFSEDGTPAKQMLLEPLYGMVVAPNGDLVFSVGSTPRVRKINAATQKLETVAGMAPNVIGIPGGALGAVFLSASGDLTFLPSGDLIYSDNTARWIYRIDVHSGAISAFAGTGSSNGGDFETPALETAMDGDGLDVDGEGIVYVTDQQKVRSIDAHGIVHRVAGLTPGETNNNSFGFGGDGGPAKDALLCQPDDVAFDRNGNLFIADSNNNRIRRVDAKSGIITTVAGSGPSNGFEGWGRGSFCGDGGPARYACFNSPIALAVRDDGSIYVNDFYNHTIRKVGSDGIVSSLSWPQTFKLIVGPGQSILGHGISTIYRADHDEARTIAGGMAGFGGDGGPATEALIGPTDGGFETGLAIDAEGNLFFHDAGNRRIRAIRFGAVLAPPNATITATASGSMIRASVFDGAGRPAPGVRVDFTTPASGASCSLSPPFAITDSNGIANVTCTANCVGGMYSVTARPLTASSFANVPFTNIAGPCRRRSVHH